MVDFIDVRDQVKAVWINNHQNMLERVYVLGDAVVLCTRHALGCTTCNRRGTMSVV